MNACILYYSQTGNTKKFAEKISNSLKIPTTYDMTSNDASVAKQHDIIILGTPVHGFNPSKESIEFVKQLPEGNGKKTILFCTYRLWKGRVFSKLKGELKKRGYSTILCVSAKAKEFTDADFIAPVQKIVETIKE
ncbi:MAG: flavodoxin family protein [Candidatus Bathyarchaeota archaeon]|nr:flavodoxin family protein [Candidatus Bathyarchaeum tardum]WGM89480.1 MAG: flavodoxin family protein [Candidatus Bathyarchaeum tardum]